MTTGTDRWNWLVRHTVCSRAAQPGEDLSGQCPSCGHATMIHVGVDACPVCELLALRNDLAEMTTQEWWRKQARINGVKWPL